MTQNRQIYALGFFDGVHLGHQALLETCCHLARQMGCTTAAITFDRHPMSLFASQPPGLICSNSDRRRLLGHYGIGYVREYPVTREVMSTSWQAFLEDLVERGAAGFVCGDDFHFGQGGRGDSAALEEFCRARGLPWTVVPEQTLDGVRISSSYIRHQLETGDMETAVRFLGHPYLLTGQVGHGHQLGRTIGIPTANMALPEGVLMPRPGVYCCRAWTGDQTYLAVTNVGTRPTVGGQGVTVEAWLLDFEGDLYGRDLTLAFYRFLRPERKFSSLAELQEEIRKNGAQTRAFFGKGEGLWPEAATRKNIG